MRSRIAFLPLYGFLLSAVLALVAPASVSAAAAPVSASLKGVPVTGQLWSLSCEYAAASAATAYYGKKITQQTFHAAIGNHVNPHKGFRGDITGAWGGTTNYGVYAGPILDILHDWGFRNSYIFYGGAETLKREIAAGRPVVVWLTGNYKVYDRVVRTDERGARYSLVPYEHAVTVIGYDATGVTVMDPGPARTARIAWGVFDRAWSQLDRMSLVVAR